MLGYQFDRILAISKIGRIESYSKKTGKPNIISVESVLNEAARVEGWCNHVLEPKSPTIIYQLKENDSEENTNGFELVKKKIDEWFSEDIDGRKIRYDANCLLSGVASMPPLKGIDNEEKKRRINKFEKDLIEWLKKEYGEELILIVRHEDEPHKGIYKQFGTHVHWHYYAVKKPEKRFDLHPGWEARRKFSLTRTERKILSKEMIHEFNEIGKDVYYAAMREYLDRYNRELGLPNEQARKSDNPRKRRDHEDQKEHEKYEKEYLCNVTELANKEKERIIEDAKREAEQIKKKADNAFREREKIIIERENKETEFEKARENDITKILFPEPNKKGLLKLSETATEYYERISAKVTGYIKLATDLIKKYQILIKRLEKKEKDLDEKIDEVKTIYDKLVGDFGGEQKLEQAYFLMRNKYHGIDSNGQKNNIERVQSGGRSG